MDDDTVKISNRMRLEEDAPLYPQLTASVRALLLYAQEERLEIDPETFRLEEGTLLLGDDVAFPVIDALALAYKGRDWRSPEEIRRSERYQAEMKARQQQAAERNRQTRSAVMELAEEIEENGEQR